MKHNIKGKGYGITPRGIEDAKPNLDEITSPSLPSKNKSLIEGNPNVKVVVDNPFKAYCSKDKKSF